MKKRPKRFKSYVPFFKRKRRFRKKTRDWDDPRYVNLRKKVLERDSYECVICGKNYNLEVHHYLNWSSHPHLRFITANCVTLCKHHHYMFHKLYSKTNNNKVQFREFYLRYHVQRKA